MRRSAFFALLLFLLVVVVALASVLVVTHTDAQTTMICPDGSRPVQCFVDPCRGVTSCRFGCVADYCGGCHARCRCLTGRECRAESESTGSANGGRCRRTVIMAPFGACDPPVNAQTTPPTDSSCAAVLCPVDTTCVSGTCVPRTVSCSSSRPCVSGSYCGSTGTCLRSGTCQVPADCANDPEFIHPMCVGTFTCAERQCGYQCTQG